VFIGYNRGTQGARTRISTLGTPWEGPTAIVILPYLIFSEHTFEC